MKIKMKNNKRSFVGDDCVDVIMKKSKQKIMKNYNIVQKNPYGDGVSWFRGAMIGQGGYGRVFLANLKNPSYSYSLFPPIMAVKSAEVSVSCSLQKEKQVMDNIRGCPNVIECFGEEFTDGENGQMVYNLLLEYGSGGTLADLINKSDGKGLWECEVKGYARSILKGLSYIHKKGYVHCDMKPDNVILVESYEKSGGFIAKVGDLGLAKRVRGNSGPYLRGTRKYLSPEALSRGDQGPASDIWAFGCVMFEMLTGKFSGQELGELDEILRQFGVSKNGRSFLKGCLCVNVMKRLSADMLLNHSFLKGVCDDDDVNEVDESEHVSFDTNAIASTSSYYDDDDDGGGGGGGSSCSSCSWPELGEVYGGYKVEEIRAARFCEVDRFQASSTLVKGF